MIRALQQAAGALLVALLFPGVLAAAPAPAASPETFLLDPTEPNSVPGWRLRMGVLASDNITRSDTDETEEIIGVGEFGANWRYRGGRFAAAFDGTIGYRHYTENNFDDETRGNFLAAGDVFIIPRTLDWFIVDRYANAPVDPLATTSPTNVQWVNVIETGPRLTLRPGRSNELTVAAAYAEVMAEESPIDHSRESATTSFFHEFSANRSLGLVANARRVNFERDAETPDFEQADAYLEYRSRDDTTNFSAAGGTSEIDLVNGFSRDTAVGWLRFGARRTSDSYVYLAAERRASDTATAMLEDDLLLEEGGTASVIVTGDPFFSDSLVARYTRGWRAHEWFLAVSAREIDYFISPLDQETRGGQFGMELMLSSRLLLELSAAANAITYLDEAREDDIRAFRAETDYRIDRHWSLVSGLRYLERESSDPTYGFDEMMLTIFLSYSARGRDPLGGEL